ncbi:copper amine oxidase N-terminal domain-containing protein [Paenibacillus sp. MWE-103]|uniref:Copper amine oxidase N-terminal domain-containing protein n=1 Tax=Paenibacillus artemisiicola TaxID=1172618 RepID=A0ABS3W9T5_9BACL|nr:copper amine oxidase N-terminal domain-containing protein [Paenibacillus artemisiicola]MBO7745087.1 copper amine oxidase N-terminal domain-containing protein [Paenibacillus artemisiicola]
MGRKLVGLLLLFCVVATIPLVAKAASVRKPIQLLVNHKQLAGVNPIVKSGVMYVPYRKFFEAMGYKAAYDPDTRQISGFINGADIKFWVGEDVIECNGVSYGLDEVIPVFNGQVYIPLRQFGYFVKYSVYFDQPKLTVSLKPYGDGQEAAVKELVTKYYETFSPQLLTSDNLTLGYMNLEYDYEANEAVSEIPVRDFKVTIDRIEYTSESEAKLQVTYIKHTEELNREDVYAFKIRYEQGQWRIADEVWIYNKMELPEDIDQKAAAIMENHFSEENAVLSDLRTYYTAYNGEDFARTLQYTAPSVIKHWDDYVWGPETWEDNLRAIFSYRDERYKLTDERVVFLGEKEAVVQGMLSWSDATEEVAEGDYVYEALIYMEYANGRWTYNSDISLDQDFDRR